MIKVCGVNVLTKRNFNIKIDLVARGFVFNSKTKMCIILRKIMQNLFHRLSVSKIDEHRFIDEYKSWAFCKIMLDYILLQLCQ